MHDSCSNIQQSDKREHKSMSTTGIGIIGCGFISSIYLTNMPLFKGLEMRGVADLNHDNAVAQGEKFGVPAYSVDELLARDDIGIILNLTIPDVHVEISSNIIAAGKSVYSEKPLGVDFEAAKELVAQAKAAGQSIGCAPDTFLGAGGRLARSIINDGSIGNILSGTVFIMSHGHEHWHPNPEFYYQHGGGPVLDMGPYYLHALINLLGPVARVRSIAASGFKERIVTSEGPRTGDSIPVETPTTMHALLEFKSGANIMFGASWDVWSHGHLPIELYGSKGSLRVPDPNFFGGKIETAIERGDWTEHETGDMPMGKLNWPEDKPTLANYRALGIAEMAAHIQNGTPHRSSGDLALHALEIMLAIVEGSADGGPVEIQTALDQPAILAEDDAQALFA